MVLSSNGELLSDPNGALRQTQGVQERGNSTHEKVLQIDCMEQGGNAIGGADTDIIDINLSNIDIIIDDDIGNDSEDSAEVAEGKHVHTTDTESVEGNEANESDIAQSENNFLADEVKTYSDSSKDFDYIVSEEYSNTNTSEDSAEESDDQSWLYEDLEGPNGDIFDETSHRRTEGPPPTVNEADNVGWYTDPDDDNELISLKGSPDEEDEADDGYPEYKEVMMKDPKLVVGMKFPSPQVFIEYLREFNVINGYDIRYIRNKSARITAVCRHNCSWRIHASPLRGTTTFQIKTLGGKHICGRPYNNKQANSKYLGKKFVDEVRDDPNINVDSLKKKVRREIIVDASRFQIYRAKRKARKIIAGDLAEQYHRIRDYATTILRKNPSSHISITTNPEKTEPTFQRMWNQGTALQLGVDNRNLRLIIFRGGHNQKSCKNRLHPKSKMVKRSTRGQSSSSQPALTSTPRVSTRGQSYCSQPPMTTNQMSSGRQTRKGGQSSSQPPVTSASIGLKMRSSRSSTQFVN
ncbi:hypothetical protein ACSBR2_029937 [Camellia fascicularis]